MENQEHIQQLLNYIMIAYNSFLKELEDLFGKSIESLKFKAKIDVLHYILHSKDNHLIRTLKKPNAQKTNSCIV